ncbi:hypothetical protein AV521_32490 [Streptomyces sp. IMTB 2501]|nr:hypothetical protein AV521_32490 [Streptomyces sp. IMTB 2501]
MIHFVLLIVCAVAIYLPSARFVNSVQWLGVRLNVARMTVGSTCCCPDTPVRRGRLSPWSDTALGISSRSAACGGAGAPPVVGAPPSQVRKARMNSPSTSKDRGPYGSSQPGS